MTTQYRTRVLSFYMTNQTLKDLISKLNRGDTNDLDKSLQDLKTAFSKNRNEPIDPALVREFVTSICSLSPSHDSAILLATNILVVSKGVSSYSIENAISFYNLEVLPLIPIKEDEEVQIWVRLGFLRSISGNIPMNHDVLNRLSRWGHMFDKDVALPPIKQYVYKSRVIEALIKMFKTQHEISDLPGWFVEWMLSTIYSSDDLVLQKTKEILVLSLMKLVKGKDELFSRILNLDFGLKIKYQVLTTYVESCGKIWRDTQIATFCWCVDADFWIEAKKRFSQDIGLAPAIADMFVALISAPKELIKGNDLVLGLLFEGSSGNANPLIAKYILPRLLKNCPEAVITLARTFKVSNDEDLEVYILIMLVACDLSLSVDVSSYLNKDILQIALDHRKDEMRLGAFGCLCKLFGPYRKVSFSYLGLIRKFVGYLLLDSTSDSRQKSLNSLQTLFTSLLARLYSLIRDESRHKDRPLEDQLGFSSLCSEKDQLLDWIKGLLILILETLNPEDYHRYGAIDLGLRIFLEVELAVCNRNQSKRVRDLTPIDSILDAYIKELFSLVQVKGKTILPAIILSNSFESNRQLAARVIMKYSVLDSNEAVRLKKISLERVRHPREAISEGAALMLSILEEFGRIQTGNGYAFHEVIRNLEGQLAVVKENIALGASQNNLNGTLILLSKLFVQHRSLNVSVPPSENDIERLVSLCKEIGQTVSDIASQPSPEGSDLGQFFDHTGTIPMSEASRLILTFCWRAIKESTKLLGELVALKFYVDPTGICDVVDHLVGLILSLRHPGAFTSIEEPLKMSCSILLRLNISLCTSHPQKVLQNAIQDCMEHPEIQTTRRSAGLPLCITAILSAYPPSSNQQNTMEQVVSTLLRELESFDLGLLNPSPSVVHCLNILRTIFRDADLALQSAPFLSGSFKVCFRGFKSSSWAVRNGAMMLFGALVRRAFGSGFGGKERSLTDLRTLVQRHPGLLEFFQIQLLDSSVDIYPLLAVLQRMKFSSGAITSHPAFFKAAINFILQRCISSKALKIRHVSARLVVESLLDFAPELVWPILQPHVLGSGLLTTSCNELHGKLYLLLQASKSHNPIQVTPEDLRILNIYWQTLKLPAAVRWIALLLANRFSAITPSFENIRSTITSCNAIEPYQFDLISTMIVMFKSCDKDMYSLILGIQFSGLQRRLLSFCLGNFCSSEPINGISIENGRVQKPLCQGLSCDTLSRIHAESKRHFGLKGALLSSLSNLQLPNKKEIVMGALYSHPKNPDIVRAALSAWLSIPDPDLDSFVRVIEGYMKFSSGHTDLMRLIAITAVGEACTGLDIDSFQEGFLIKLFRLLRLGLIDDDEDVRDAAAMAFTACFSYEKSSTSVPAALADLYLRAMKSLSPFGFKQLILNLSAPEWPIGEECEVLFVKEPENLFVNVEWEHRLIKNTL